MKKIRFPVLLSKCRSSTHTRHEYVKFLPLTEFAGSRPKGFIARIAVYALGPHDAHIALAVNDHPKLDEAMYEIGKHHLRHHQNI